MPFVQISLARGRTQQVRTAITQAVHSSLVEEFQIPELDKFQLVHELDTDHLIFPSSYLEVPHTDKIIFIHITAKEGRTVEMKKRLYQKIAERVSGAADIASDDVFIVLTENKAENWSFGRGQAQLA